MNIELAYTDPLFIAKIVLMVLVFLFCGKLVNWLVPQARRWLVSKLQANLAGDAITLNNIESRAKTLGLALRKGSIIAIRIMAAITLLSILGIDTTPISAAVCGGVGVAFGFGSHNLIRDLISGLYILLEDRFHLNDLVKINGVEGRVVDMTFRTIVLKESGKPHLHIFQNGKIDTLTVHRRDIDDS